MLAAGLAGTDPSDPALPVGADHVVRSAEPVTRDPRRDRPRG
jgi:hypothetical protein